MKQTYYLALAAILFSCAEKKGNTFEVTGTLKNSQTAMIYLQDNPSNGQPVIIDSARLQPDGSFSLTGTGVEQSLFTLRTKEAPYPFAVLVNDTKRITVHADEMNRTSPYTVSGSPASQGIIDFDRTASQHAQRVYELSRGIDSMLQAKAPDSLLAGPYAQFDAETGALKAYTNRFIEEAKSPVLAMYAMGSYQRLAQQLGIKGYSNLEVGEIVNRTAGKFPAHNALAELKKKVLPNQAPDFSLPDTTGTPVALSSFKGKYVLVDFWASWCQPCRLENPNIVQNFNRFKDKNFTILGVSLDKTKEAWLAAIQKDNLTWTHVSDLQYWNSAAATLYNVSSIPYNVLLDPQGKIIAENLRGPELGAKLAEILK